MYSLQKYIASSFKSECEGESFFFHVLSCCVKFFPILCYFGKCECGLLLFSFSVVTVVF